MTIHIQMLQDIAAHARAMADSMQAIVDDCAEQLARRKAGGESEEAIMNEPFDKVALHGFDADHRGVACLCGGALYPGKPPEDQGDSRPVWREEAHRAFGKSV